MDEVLRPEHVESDPNSSEASKEKKRSKESWQLYHEKASTNWKFWPILSQLLSPNTSQSVLIMMAWKFYKPFLWSLEMKFMPVMCLPQDAYIYPYVQLYVQLPMKHHTGTLLVSLDDPTLAPAIPGPV